MQEVNPHPYSMINTDCYLRLVSLFLLSAAGVSMTTQAATITNGSFETNTSSSTYQSLYSGWGGTITGWDFSTSPTAVLIGNTSGYEYATPYGDWQIDLTGADNVAGPWAETTITGLDVGQLYDVNFFFGSSTAWTGGGLPGVRLTIDGSYSQDFTHNPTSTMEWVSKTYSFTASASSQALRFTNISTGFNGLANIDNISISAAAAPEPGRVVLMIGGLCGVALRRRKQV